MQQRELEKSINADKLAFIDWPDVRCMCAFDDGANNGNNRAVSAVET